MTNQQNPQNEENMTPEQLEEMRSKMMEYYTKQIPLLELQKQVETLASDVEEARFKRIRASISIAQVMAGPRQEESAENPSPEFIEEVKQARKLKTDK